MYGRTVFLTSTIYSTRVTADGSPQFKAGGITIDWNTVTAPTSATTLTDGSVIQASRKFLRYGQVVCAITAGATQVATLNGTPTGGTFTLTVTNGSGSATTTALAYNAANTTVQTALQALANVGSGNATVTGSAGGPYTIVYATTLGNTTTTANGAALTGGTNMSVTVATTDQIPFAFGPYDPAAADGRQTLTRGRCYILDETVLQYPNESALLGGSNDQYGSALEGGLLFLERVLQSGTNTHTLAAGPTEAELLAAFPSARFVRGE